MKQTSRAKQWIVSISVVTALVGGLVGCSGGGASPGSPAEANAPTHLDGLYKSTTEGDLQWISFQEPNVFGLLRSGAGCDASTPADDCYAAGTYTLDAASSTLQLADWRTQTTISLPVSAVQTTAAAGPLTTQDTSPGALVGASPSAIVTPTTLSITNADGTTQALVQTADLKNVIYTCVLVCQVCLSNPLQPQTPTLTDIPSAAAPSCIVKPKKGS